jgi:hypothetical protein
MDKKYGQREDVPSQDEYIAMYGQTVRAEEVVPSGTSIGNQAGGVW